MAKHVRNITVARDNNAVIQRSLARCTYPESTPYDPCTANDCPKHAAKSYTVCGAKHYGDRTAAWA